VARRRRSYRKNSDDVLGTFFNNAMASSQKSATAARRQRDAAARRDATAAKRSAARAAKEAEQRRKTRAREAERDRKAAEREAEARRKAEEKERERVRKEKAKLDEKVSKVMSRVLLDLETVGLFPGESTATAIALEAVEKSVTPAQAKKYFISPREESVARECAQEYLEGSIRCELRFRSITEYEALVSFVSDFRPQAEIEKSDDYQSLKAGFEEAISVLLEREALEEKERQERESREAERQRLYQKLCSSKAMFQDELEEFFDLISERDLSLEQALESNQYAEAVRNKQEYWVSINAQLSEFDL
jgi:hypothetical protein